MADLYGSRALVAINDGTALANNAGVINAAPGASDYALEVRQIGLPAAAALADATANPTLTQISGYLMGYNGTTWDRLRSTTANGLAVDVTRVTGTVTVDSELPAAAALTDAFANPTAPGVGAFLMGWNSATWDRLKSTTANGLVVDVSRVQGTVTTTLPAAAALADATANPTVPTVGDALLSFNGTTWDRTRNTTASDGNGALTTTGILAAGVGPGFARRFNPANLATAANSVVAQDVNGAGTVAIEIGTATTGTITFEATVDGTNWVAAITYEVGAQAFVTGTSFAPAVGKTYLISANGMRQVRLRTATTLGVTVANVWTLSLGDILNIGTAAANASVNLTQVAGAAIALGQTTMSASLPVTLASNQGNINVALAASSATVTVDSELPAAAALTDAFANPTAPAVGGFLMGWNGTTWDRLKSTTGNGLAVDVTRVTGTVTVDSELPAAAALADATANPTVPGVGGFLMGYNGTTWDRVRTANTGRLQVDVVTGGGSAPATGVPSGYNLIGLYGTAAAVAAGATSTGVVTNTPASTKTFFVRTVKVSASGQTKWQVKFGATVLDTGFNSQEVLSQTVFYDPPLSGTGDGATALTVDVTNREGSAMDVYAGLRGWVLQ